MHDAFFIQVMRASSICNNIVCTPSSLDGKFFASGSLDGTIGLWDAVTRNERQVLEGHSHALRALEFSPDGKILGSGSADQTIHF